MTDVAWLRAHPFLEPLSRLHSRVEYALAEVSLRSPALPAWDDYVSEYGEGIPLLRSSGVTVDLEPAAAMTLALIDRLGDLTSELRASTPQRVVDALLGEPSDGLLRWLAWTAARRSLKPLLETFQTRRQEDRWQRPHCPACGAPPAMGQLIGVDPGFVRYLSCGCCGSRWRWRRTACPFCETDDHRLEVVKIESEPRLRIDHCESCRAYLKTYVGTGDEAMMLADWTSLHLDVLARERGLERKAQSLYDLSALLDAPA